MFPNQFALSFIMKRPARHAGVALLVVLNIQCSLNVFLPINGPALFMVGDQLANRSVGVKFQSWEKGCSGYVVSSRNSKTQSPI